MRFRFSGNFSRKISVPFQDAFSELYNKYASNAKKIKGNGLSEDEKKAVYRAAAKETRQRLMTKFNKEEVQKIINLERESFKK